MANFVHDLAGKYPGVFSAFFFNVQLLTFEFLQGGSHIYQKHPSEMCMGSQALRQQ